MPDSIAAQVHDTARTEQSKEDVFFALLSGLAGLHSAMSVISLARSYMKVCEQSGLKLNPYFVKNGNCGPSPKTQRMLAHRKLKGLGVGATGVTVPALSPSISPVPMPFYAVRHASATASTAIHLRQLSKLLAAYQPFAAGDEQVSDAIKWLQLAIEVKLKKLAFRGTEMAVSTTSTLLSFTGIGLVGKIPLIMVSFQLELARLMVSDRYAALCKVAAMELHWAAFLEQNPSAADMPQASLAGLSRTDQIKQLEQRKMQLGAAITTQLRSQALNARTGNTGLGPATLIIKEIMAKHTLQGQFFAGHDYLAMIQEPAGWNAIAAKLMNI
ncbi:MULTISPECIES: hypothetical protein [unclassified Pseudomonas]|uniref:hypothetical protein n=1 Tax=unclassified Pseudomonas TaxID=196821 RepID=UPI000AB5A798|nr:MULTISPECIES: hypothetical protein [unclassified Pseudomonas]MBY8947969.1 hypothetical protein [Pseudomonas sp. SH10-3B]